MGSNGRRPIELSLPLKPISAQSAREKLIRPGHISTLQTWCVRRPLAAIPDYPSRLPDLFTGGGATGPEALNLGSGIHALELNPVLNLTELCTLSVHTVARWPLSNTCAVKDKLYLFSASLPPGAATRGTARISRRVLQGGGSVRVEPKDLDQRASN